MNGASFHVLIFQVYIFLQIYTFLQMNTFSQIHNFIQIHTFLSEMSVSCHFKIGLFIFSLLKFKSSLYILEDSLLPNSYFCKCFLTVFDFSFPNFDNIFHRAECFKEVFYLLQIQGHLDFLFCYLLDVLQYCLICLCL
jgi:hypothetical protein